MGLSDDLGLRKQQLRIDQYRGLAREATLAAACTPLERVRDQREAAASSWTVLADAEQQRLTDRLARLASIAR